MPNHLEESIAKTIVWFSLFKQPLTTFEVWKWLFSCGETYSLGNVENTLEQSKWLRERIKMQDGYLFWSSKKFPAKEALQKRHASYFDSLQKHEAIRGVVKYLSWVPGVVAVGAVNSLGMWNTKPESDIDFLIIVKPGLIWTARFLSVLPFAILKRRPKKGTKNFGYKRYPLCFSFFLSTNSLCLEGASLKDGDPYLVYWISQITPLYDSGRWFETMPLANSWIKKTLPNTTFTADHDFLMTKRRIHFGFLDSIFKLLEPVLRLIQKRRLPLSIRLTRATDRSIVIDDNILKFHETDRRANFRQGFEERLRVFWENG